MRTYCLSDVMPGCKIHLSSKPSEERIRCSTPMLCIDFMIESSTKHGALSALLTALQATQFTKDYFKIIKETSRR